MKSALFCRTGAVLAAAMAMTGCQQQDSAGAPRDQASAQAPDAKPGIVVSDAVLLLPVVPGRPAAAYFTVKNGGENATALAAVYIEGAAKAEMHETKGGKMEPLGSLPLARGETARFERGGKHVMVFDLADTLIASKTAEMTLTFSGGDKVSAPIRVEKMAGTHEGMAH